MHLQLIPIKHEFRRPFKYWSIMRILAILKLYETRRTKNHLEG